MKLGNDRLPGYALKIQPVLSLAALLLSVSTALAEEKTPQQIYEAAEQAIAEQRWEAAVDGYLKLATLNPQIAEIHAKVGWIYYQMGRFQDAVPPFRHALKTKPELVTAEVLLAVSLSELGRFDESVPILEKHFPEPPDPALKRIMGLELQRGYLGLKRFDEAAEQALQMVRLYPEDPEVIYYTGRLFGDFSFVTMQKLPDLAPDSLWSHLALAEAFEAQGKPQVAMVEYGKVVEQQPNRAGIHVRIGRIMRYDLQPRPPLQEIQREFERELEIDPTNATAAYELGEIHRISGRAEQALKLLTQAVELYPAYEEARIGLARALIQAGRHKDALPHLTSAVEVEPNNETSHYLLSQVYLALGDREAQQRALAEFDRLKNERLGR